VGTWIETSPQDKIVRKLSSDCTRGPTAGGGKILFSKRKIRGWWGGDFQPAKWGICTGVDISTFHLKKNDIFEIFQRKFLALF
jgi:hypothetical protein